MPLLADAKTGRIIVVGTRWFQFDLMSWITDNEPSYVWHRRAVLENENGEADETGHLTYPSRFDQQVLDEIKHAMGPYMFSCLYLNKPVNPDTMVFKPGWIQHYLTQPNNCVYFTTVDPASDSTVAKSKQSKLDDQVVMTCAKDLESGDVYVVMYDRFKGNPSMLNERIFAHVAMFKPVVVAIESNAYQNTIAHWLREMMVKQGTWFTVQLITNTQRSKADRIRGLQPMFNAGKIFLKAHMKDLVQQLLDYPLGKHDDIIDCLAMQLKCWMQTRSKDEEKPSKDRRQSQLTYDYAVQEIEDNLNTAQNSLDMLYSNAGGTYATYNVALDV